MNDVLAARGIASTRYQVGQKKEYEMSPRGKLFFLLRAAAAAVSFSDANLPVNLLEIMFPTFQQPFHLIDTAVNGSTVAKRMVPLKLQGYSTR